MEFSAVKARGKAPSPRRYLHFSLCNPLVYSANKSQDLSVRSCRYMGRSVEPFVLAYMSQCLFQLARQRRALRHKVPDPRRLQRKQRT